MYDTSPVTHKRVTKPSPDMTKCLALPYEILQVWRAHVLFTDKYMELCKLVSQDKFEFIPFTPPKPLWKSQQVDNLQQNFRINREIILGLAQKKKERN